MKYAIISVVNGNFKIEAEYGTNLQGAIVGFHDKCKNYWNAGDVISAVVMVVDENMACVEDKVERITHSQAE